jgi:hypothetical protein
MYKKKMAPAPALNPPKASNKNTKHVSFAEPLVSFFGETNEVASEPPPFLILPVSCSINPANIFDPMLHEFLIHAEQGGPVKKATVTVDQELLKARKSGNNMVQDKGADAGADPLRDLLVSSFCSRSVAVQEDINVAPSPAPISPMNTTTFLHMSQSHGLASSSSATIEVGSDPHNVIEEGHEFLGDLDNPISTNIGPNIVSLPTLDNMTSPRPEYAEATNIHLQNQTPIVEGHVQPEIENGNGNGLLDNSPVDRFLASISTEVAQSLLPDPAPLNTPQPQPKFKSQRAVSTVAKRKSVRLSAKAQSRIGKHTLEIAQDLLVKKLGDLSPVPQAVNIPNIDSFSQHFDQPLTQNTMEALQVLVEHGAQKMKKGADPKKQGPATSMEVA